MARTSFPASGDTTIRRTTLLSGAADASALCWLESQHQSHDFWCYRRHDSEHPGEEPVIGERCSPTTNPSWLRIVHFRVSVYPHIPSTSHASPGGSHVFQRSSDHMRHTTTPHNPQDAWGTLFTLGSLFFTPPPLTAVTRNTGVASQSQSIWLHSVALTEDVTSATICSGFSSPSLSSPRAVFN